MITRHRRHRPTQTVSESIYISLSRSQFTMLLTLANAIFPSLSILDIICDYIQPYTTFSHYSLWFLSYFVIFCHFSRNFVWVGMRFVLRFISCAFVRFKPSIIEFHHFQSLEANVTDCDLFGLIATKLDKIYGN